MATVAKYLPGSTVTAGSSYDDSNTPIRIDDQQLIQLATQKIPAVGEDIAQRLESISQTLQALALTWTGQSSTLANDFNERWHKAMTDLFGTQQKPGDGVLNLIATGVKSASYNFGYAEDTVVQMFNKMADSLNSSQQGGAPSTPTSQMNPPIQEIF